MTYIPLSAEKIAALCGLDPSTISVFDSLPSTNTYLSALAREGEHEGRIILAEEQTAGRGRLGRQFFSPKGSGIYLSVLLRPRVLDPGRLTTLSAVVVASAIERIYDIKVGIKWVNDLLFDGKKLCGILAEGAGREFAVLGIGINVTRQAFPPELADIATSLEDIWGKVIDRNVLVAEILKGFENAEPEGFSHMEEYRRRSLTLGKKVSVLGQDEILEILAIEDDGALLARGEDGQVRRISSGEVSIRNL